MEEKIKEKLYLVLTGVLTGVANGFFGGGGGMVVVPLMTFLLKLRTKVAHATAIAVILPVTVVGAWLLGKLSAKWVTRIFAIVMFAAGVKLLFF